METLQDDYQETTLFKVLHIQGLPKTSSFNHL